VRLVARLRPSDWPPPPTSCLGNCRLVPLGCEPTGKILHHINKWADEEAQKACQKLQDDVQNFLVLGVKLLENVNMSYKAKKAANAAVPCKALQWENKISKMKNIVSPHHKFYLGRLVESSNIFLELLESTDNFGGQQEVNKCAARDFGILQDEPFTYKRCCNCWHQHCKAITL